MVKYRLSAIVEKERKWYVSRCAELGVVSQGRTIDKAISNLKEAVELYLKHAEPHEFEFLKKHVHEEPVMATISVRG